jgi:hypothetical protein
VLNDLDRDDDASIAILKVLKTDLAYIYANFSFLSHSIAKLENTTNLLLDTVKEINGTVK